MNKYILIVENDPICVFLINKLINKLDPTIQLKSCENGLQAIEQLTREHKVRDLLPDLILLDWNMSVMGGQEFLEIKSKLSFLSDIPVYVMSTSLLERDKSIAKSLGVLDFFTKPFTAFTFEKIMGAKLHHSS